MAKPLQALVVALALAASPAMAKSLHWRDLDVAARLDRDGRLHVSERQTIVFDGDWNGGERTFRVPAGQSLEFESIARVDGGAERPFQRGDLSRVDHYDFTSPNVLRWRSRLPDDPPFANTAITYVLRYTLLGVLRETDGAYRLSHDFAFPDRSGVIERFALQFDLDPVWRGVQSPIRIARRGLLPGQSVVVRESLTYGGPGSPAAAVHALSPRIVYGVLVLFAFAMLFLLFDFFVDEQPKGRFAPLLSPDAIDESWLAENLLVLKPEVAGAALDGRVGADEVAAVLARMTHEKKIASSVETRRRLLKKRQVLRLELLVDRKALSGYESDLVRRLFFDGRTTTSTDALQTHYRSSGFDPAKIVEKGVTPVLQRFEAWGKDRRRADWKRDSVYLGAAHAPSRTFWPASRFRRFSSRR